MKTHQIYIDEMIYDKLQYILKEYHKDLSEVINEYLHKIVTKPEVLNKENDFIGILDGKIGDIDYKTLKREKNENFS